jgi:hypothetical protein
MSSSRQSTSRSYTRDRASCSRSSSEGATRYLDVDRVSHAWTRRGYIWKEANRHGHCKPYARHFFERSESLIAAALHSEKYPHIALHLELVPGFVELATPPSPNREAKPHAFLHLKNKPENGASIGVQHKQLGAGTLGGWVTLKPINSPSIQPLQCALTCYHVINEGDPANQAHNDRNGIGLMGETPLSQIQIVWPSNFDVIEIRRVVQSRIQAPGSSDESRQRDENYLKFLNGLSAAGPIGHVRFASGSRRTTDDRRLDWALIVSPKTFTRNRPPPSAAFDDDEAWDENPFYQTDEMTLLQDLVH